MLALRIAPDNKAPYACTAPAVGVAFEILRDDGNMAGKSAEDGSTQLQKSTGMDSYVIRYKGELP
jgi:type VI secretion system secreted protein VgrG